MSGRYKKAKPDKKKRIKDDEWVMIMSSKKYADYQKMIKEVQK